MTERPLAGSDSDQAPLQSVGEPSDLAIHNVIQAPTNYRIEMLPAGAGGPAPASEVLPAERPSDPSIRTQEFVDGYTGGTIAAEIVTDAWDVAKREGTPCFVVHHKVTGSTVDELGVPRELFVDGKFQHPGQDQRRKLADEEYPDQTALDEFDVREREAAKLHDMVTAELTSEQRQAEVEGFYKQQANKVERIYVDDLSGVEKRETGLETLHQAFDLATTVEGEADGNVRVLNFSTKEMTESDVADIAEALAYFAERTGGAIYDRFDNIVIVPADHPSLKVMGKDKEGRPKQLTRRGYMAPRTLVFSELVLLPPEEQPEATKESTEYFHSFLRPGESAEGPDAPVRTVAQGRFRATIAHEMTHMCLYDRGIPVLTAKSLYSRTRPDEWDAERGAAEYLGEEHLVPEDPDVPGQLATFQAKWKWLRNKAALDGRSQGRRFVTAIQHDLTSGRLPRRLRKLPTEVTYKLVEEDPSSASDAVAAA